MSGLVTAGVLLCGLPHAMAESVPQNNETYYSVNVPSEISLSPDQDETTFTVSGNTYQKRWLDIDITSKNNFNLKNGQVSIPYKLDKTKFEYEPQYVDKDSDSFSESIKVSKNEADVKYSGNYQDQLQFTMNPIETRTIQLDCNGGTVNGKDKVAYTVKNGSSYGQLPLPVRSGYEFVAWKDEKGNTIYSGSTVLSNTEKLTAKYLQGLQLNIFAEINGEDNGSIEGIGTADLYKNGKLIDKGRNGLRWVNGVEGDVFRIDNFKINKDFKCVKYNPCNGYTVNFNKDGELESIEITLTAENTGKGVTLYFESSSQLQTIINKTKANTVVFDSDIPTTKHTSTGTLDIFNTNADTYCSENILHIFNPDGGKVIAPSNCEKMFVYLKVDTLDFKNLDTSNVTDGEMMFANTTARQIFLNDWNTSKITNLASMFYYCKQLEVLNLSNWNTSNVTSTYQFLWHCNKLTSIDVSSFDTSNISNMNRMFGECYSLLEIKGLENFDTHSAQGLAAMFQNCKSLKELDVSSFDTSNASWLHYMFSGCTSLRKIEGLQNFNTSKSRTFADMFAFCTSLKELDLNSFDTSSSTDFSYMFQGCTSLRALDLSHFNTDKVKGYSGMFSMCENLKNIYVSKNFENTDTAISVSMFDRCPNLVGGAGTKYDPTFIDSTAARIDGGINSPGYFTAISDKPLETSQTNESNMSETTGNELRSIETPVKEPDELESDSKQNETESQQ